MSESLISRNARDKIPSCAEFILTLMTSNPVYTSMITHTVESNGFNINFIFEACEKVGYSFTEGRDSFHTLMCRWDIAVACEFFKETESDEENHYSEDCFWVLPPEHFPETDYFLETGKIVHKNKNFVTTYGDMYAHLYDAHFPQQYMSNAHEVMCEDYLFSPLMIEKALEKFH